MKERSSEEVQDSLEHRRLLDLRVPWCCPLGVRCPNVAFEVFKGARDLGSILGQRARPVKDLPPENQPHMHPFHIHYHQRKPDLSLDKPEIFVSPDRKARACSNRTDDLQESLDLLLCR